MIGIGGLSAGWNEGLIMVAGLSIVRATGATGWKKARSSSWGTVGLARKIETCGILMLSINCFD